MLLRIFQINHMYCQIGYKEKRKKNPYKDCVGGSYNYTESYFVRNENENINLCITAIKVAHYFKYIFYIVSCHDGDVCLYICMCVWHNIYFLFVLGPVVVTVCYTSPPSHLTLITSIRFSKWLRHMYTIMAQQYQIPGFWWR